MNFYRLKKKNLNLCLIFLFHYIINYIFKKNVFNEILNNLINFIEGIQLLFNFEIQLEKTLVN